MNIKPLGERVLIKIAKAETKTASGLYIPDTASQEKTQEGEVVSLGEKVEESSLKVGVRVVYDKYAGNSLKVDDEEFLVVKAEDVIAVLS